MITVSPGETVSQHRDDTVIYRLPFAVWSADLESPADKDAKVVVVTKRGALPLAVRVQAYRAGSHASEVRVSGGSRLGLYEIARTVKSESESRRRFFTVNIT